MAKGKKRAKLPFVVAPRLQPVMETVGTEESGQFEVVRQGYLTVGEKAFMANAEAQDDSTGFTINLCRQIAKDLKLDLNEAYSCVVSAATNQGEDKYGIADKYPEEMKELLSVLIASEQRRNYMKCLCLLLYRVDSELGMEEIGSLHPDLVDALVALYEDEEARSVERLEQSASSEQDAKAVEDVSKK